MSIPSQENKLSSTSELEPARAQMVARLQASIDQMRKELEQNLEKFMAFEIQQAPGQFQNPTVSNLSSPDNSRYYHPNYSSTSLPFPRSFPFEPIHPPPELPPPSVSLPFFTTTTQSTTPYYPPMYPQNYYSEPPYSQCYQPTATPMFNTTNTHSTVIYHQHTYGENPYHTEPQMFNPHHTPHYTINQTTQTIPKFQYPFTPYQANCLAHTNDILLVHESSEIGSPRDQFEDSQQEYISFLHCPTSSSMTDLDSPDHAAQFMFDKMPQRGVDSGNLDKMEMDHDKRMLEEEEDSSNLEMEIRGLHKTEEEEAFEYPIEQIELPVSSTKYAAAALFALSVHESQIHQTRPSSSLLLLDQELASEGVSVGDSEGVSILDDSRLWIYEKSGLLYPVFKLLGVDDQAWHGLEETVGTSSQVEHHIGSFLTLLSQQSDGTCSGRVDKELILTKVGDAHKMFDNMPERYSFTSNVIIAAYMRKGNVNSRRNTTYCDVGIGYGDAGRGMSSSLSSRILIKGGTELIWTVVNAPQQEVAEVYVEDGIIVVVKPNIKVDDDVTVLDAAGKFVMPGGIDPHVHLAMEYMGITETVDYFFSDDQAAALAGGTTMHIDFVIPVYGRVSVGLEELVLELFGTVKKGLQVKPCDFSIRVYNTCKDLVNLTSPRCILDGPLMKIWYKLDKFLKLLRANAYFRITLKGGFDTVTSCLLTELFISLLKDKLNEIVHQPRVAKMETSKSILSDKLELKVYGFNDNKSWSLKLPDLLTKVLAIVTSFCRTNGSFKVIKEDMERTLKNANMKPLSQPPYVRLQILCEHFWDVDEELCVLKELSLADLKASRPNLLSQLCIDGLCKGNLLQKEAIQYLCHILGIFPPYGLLPSENTKTVCALDYSNPFLQRSIDVLEAWTQSTQAPSWSWWIILKASFSKVSQEKVQPCSIFFPVPSLRTSLI